MTDPTTHPSGNGWLLLVEPDYDLEMMALRAHRTSGRWERLVVARDSAEARLALEFGDPPAMIITEMAMPGMEGLGMLESLKSDPVLRGVPVVVLASSAEPDAIRESYELGASCYVCKPIDFGAYGRLIQTIMGLWLPSLRTARRGDLYTA